MNKFLSVFLCGLIALPAIAATPATQARRSMQTQMVTSAPRRATLSTGQISAVSSMATARVDLGQSDNSNDNGNNAGNDTDNNKPSVDDREKEKNACINNNVGIGNTFVWASRYSNLNNYAAMVEDVENPENNTCFVLVGVKSNDSRINVSDVPTKYFEWGQTITCGEWADADKLEQRILDAKKTARTWATVGGSVGGAGVGVGIMELFGNKLIGGDVQGQKTFANDKTKLLKSQLAVLQEQNPKTYAEFQDKLKEIKKLCNDESLWPAGTEKPSACTEYDYASLLEVMK